MMRHYGTAGMTGLLLVLVLVVVGCAGPVLSKGNDSVKMIIGPEKAKCTGVAPMECLQVKYNEQDDWQLFYSAIEGFTFEPGYSYVLDVRKTQRENVPADASAFKYELVRVVSKTPATVPPAPSVGALEGPIWILQGGGAEITAQFDGTRVAGKAGCNRYFGGYSLNGSALMFKGMGSTRMACAEAIMQAEQAFLKALAAATSYTVNGNTLTIAYDGGTLVFQAQ